MHARYTLPEMKKLWSEESKLEAWLQVEIAFLHARMMTGSLPKAAYNAIETHAKISVARMQELEAEFGHDMIAFVVAIQESLAAAGVGAHASEIHKYLTSYDVEDPAMVFLLRNAISRIRHEMLRLEEALRKKAREHQWTLMIGRTHGQSAEPTTFGHLLLVFAEAVKRSRTRLNGIYESELSEGKISGAVGNYPGLDPNLERMALGVLNLTPAKAETQILQRDRHAAVLSAIAVAGGTIEQICRTFWEMMRSDVGELEEPRRKKQRGSSRMAYKKNPILTEQLQGLPRLLRGYALAAMENIATPECRDISQSSVERHIFPGATALLHYMTSKLATMVDGLVVHPERMRRNLDRTQGVWAAQPIRDALMEHGVSYDDAYLYLQTAGFAAQEEETPLIDLLSRTWISDNDRRTAEKILGKERLASFFDPLAYIKNGIEHIFQVV